MSARPNLVRGDDAYDGHRFLHARASVLDLEYEREAVMQGPAALTSSPS